MTIAVLDAMAATQGALVVALGGTDPAAIEAASGRFRDAVANARATGAWRADPALAKRAAQLLGETELAFQRVKQLTREVRERRAVIDRLRGGGGSALYDQGGRTA